MLTTTLHSSKTQPNVAARPRTAESAAVPRHLAVSVSAGGDSRNIHAASSALRILAESCAGRGVEFLTLVSHGDTEDTENGGARGELFERAAAQINWREFDGLHVRVLSGSDGRDELVAAARKLAEQARAETLKPEAISARDVEHALHSPALPPVDFLLVLDAGERLTGVLLWHCAYAEFVFQQQNWWETSAANIDQAFADYARRCRKFGGLA